MKNQVSVRLRLGMSRLDLRMYAPLLEQMERAYSSWQHDAEKSTATRGQSSSRLIRFLSAFLRNHQGTQDALRSRYADYNNHYRTAVSDAQKQHAILLFARDMGASRRQLFGDRRAFRRWFGHEVVSERYMRRYAKGERLLSFTLDRLGVIAADVLQRDVEHGLDNWPGLGMEALVEPYLTYDGDSRVRVAAFRCLARALAGIQSRGREGVVTDSTLRYVYRSAMDHRQDVWIQCEALDLMQHLSQDSLSTVIRYRLQNCGEGDDLFVRRRCVYLLTRSVRRDPLLADLLPATLEDPDPYVRQALAQGLAALSPVTASILLAPLIQDDEEPSVRAAALNELEHLVTNTTLFEKSLAALNHSLANESDSFVTRMALDAIGRCHRILVETDAEKSQAWLEGLMVGMKNLHINAEALSIRRWAAHATERLWVQNSPIRLALFERVKQEVQRVERGRSVRVKVEDAKGLDQQTLGRILAAVSVDDHGLDLEQRPWGWNITRGHVRRFRTWRFIYEFMNSSTDKRQAFRHTIGRVFRGNIRAPSSILAELAETKVPGEPLTFDSENGWRPYVPLVDELISAIDQGSRPVR
ncbi:MAG: HEAT repeat domain-containing protein, partial [Gammaproteobacteria bacterium]|nr:HEAT repeat domain-containing protein [Gammaproteobacteria bacterium]